MTFSRRGTILRGMATLKHNLLALCLTCAAGLFFFAFPAAASPSLSLPQDDSAAVIFAYHRIGEDSFPATSISMESFAAHIQELKTGGYNIMPVPEIVAAQKAGKKLPPFTVGVTFDGGYKSVMTQAAPLLLKNDIPFTIFLPPDRLDSQSSAYMDWNDAEHLGRNKLVSFGIHPAFYTRLSGAAEADIAQALNTSRAKFRDHFGKEPTLFAYPFGEYSAAYRSAVEKQEFSAAFGQQSAVAYAGADIFAMPRFPMTESVGDLDHFRLVARALPLPVEDVTPRDPQLDTATPVIGFTIDRNLKTEAARLSCFASGQNPPALQIMGEGRVELRPEKPLDEERLRINCTLPVAPDQAGDDPRWRWFGLLLVAPGQPDDEDPGTLAKEKAVTEIHSAGG